MVSNSRWALKIVALLHDPPDKSFGIAGHRNRALELQRIALGRDPTEEELTRVEQADHIASAADRVDFPTGSEAYWHQEMAILTHPLSGRRLDPGKIADVNTSDTHRAAKNALQQLVQDEQDLRRRYLRLWRELPEMLASEYPRVGALFNMLPADTRQPDHPLLQHLFITAALADALPHPALLVFSIGPVQSFISAARRTQDLWMGSWLLSYLSWVAMETIVKDYGPDTIIFPSLRGQPLCDLWLHSQGIIPEEDKPRPEELALASLPNKFVALLPEFEAESAAQTAEMAVRDRWHELAEGVRTFLEGLLHLTADVWQELWREQIDSHLEVYWSILPWPGQGERQAKDQAEEVRRVYSSLAQEPETFKAAYEHYVKSGKYSPNWGTTYSLLYSLADRSFNARKSLRNFVPTEDKGEKCSLCGKRAILHGGVTSRVGVRRFWEATAQEIGPRAIKPGGRERLCAVCTVKRLAQRTVLEDQIGLRGGFPSTSEIAVAPFKAALIKELTKSNPSLHQTLHLYLTTLEQLNLPKTVSWKAVPSLQRLWSKASEQLKNLVDQVLQYDGSLFLEETLTAERLRDDYGLEADEQAIQTARATLRDLIETAERAGIGKPAKYYAVLAMDGDHAGRWLSGTHEGLTEFGKILHPRVEEELLRASDWEALLKTKRLMTPALHAAISEALASFALKLVRYVVEERHTGRVIYAGGDDVLAFLPLDEALPAARELRALFSGEVKLVNPTVPPQALDLRKQDWVVAFSDPECTGYLRIGGEILLTMGPTATASIGIAVAHHLQPLDAVIEAARQAERAAKDVYGRNAVCIHLLKRSGEESQVGMKWFYTDEVDDSVQLVTDIVQRFRNGELAMRLPATVFQEARTLAGLGTEAQRAELARLIRRHLSEEVLKEHRDELARELVKRLTAFAVALGEHSEAKKSGIEQMADWLRIARFMARGGEE